MSALGDLRKLRAAIEHGDPVAIDSAIEIVLSVVPTERQTHWSTLNTRWETRAVSLRDSLEQDSTSPVFFDVCLDLVKRHTVGRPGKYVALDAPAQDDGVIRVTRRYGFAHYALDVETETGKRTGRILSYVRIS